MAEERTKNMNDIYVLIISILIFLLIAAIVYIVELWNTVQSLNRDYNFIYDEYHLLAHKFKIIDHRLTEYVKLMEGLTKNE